jgi:hypothetical protein
MSGQSRLVLYQNGTTKNLTYLQAKRDVLRNRSDVKEEQLEQFPEYYETERTVSSSSVLYNGMHVHGCVSPNVKLHCYSSKSFLHPYNTVQSSATSLTNLF